MTAAGVRTDVAGFMWDQAEPYYFQPLTPYPSDRIYGDLKIDPDDISYLAMDFENRFKVKFGCARIDCPDDPTIAELALALQEAGQPTHG